MVRRVRIAAALAVVVALVVAGPVTARSGDPADDARRFIEGLADKAIAALTVEDMSRDERITRFRSLLTDHFAVDTIGRWVLGRRWRRATNAERDEYLKLFEDLIVFTYVDRFTQYSGEQLSVTKTLFSDESKDALAFSEISRPTGGEPIEVAWRVRIHKGDMKIVDVIVEGVSMGQTQRSEFGSVIRRNGGRVSSLIDELRRRLDGNA